jgi:uncharacterized protein (DUF2235 family)
VPKNIILLSDGTGNSASKPFKTNVWRIYQALDIRDPPRHGPLQVVMYDNGVGTESFKPLALLGLGFGIGLARNVRDLYTFLCRNYEPGDSIYLFGFSRGAFTVRILAGLLLRCGVVTWPSEVELDQRVKLAYAEYKRDAARRATATRHRLVMGHILGGSSTGQDTDHISFNFPQHFPGIRFMGIWDTVDAYGMPIDELKEAIDQYIWPMTLADRKLSDHIERVCHALSLDDERPTFRPVLWTDPHTNPSRLTQLWFAGVHTNVGGGYPDDGLSYVTLQWIMAEARRHGLRFYRDHWMECQSRADAHGEQYDSRSGLAGYYRYGPRDVDALCDDGQHQVLVARPQIHDSAMKRIKNRQVAYAPISFPRLPRGYDLLGSASPGDPSRLVPLPTEPPGDLEVRAKDMEPVRDAVVRRRVAYFATVTLTVVLALLPGVDWLASVGTWPTMPPFSGIVRLGEALSRIPIWSSLSRLVGRLLSWTLELNVVPAWASFWLTSFAKHPALFLFCAVVVLWLFFRKSHLLQDEIFARAEYAWRRV